MQDTFREASRFHPATLPSSNLHRYDTHSLTLVLKNQNHCLLHYDCWIKLTNTVCLLSIAQSTDMAISYHHL